MSTDFNWQTEEDNWGQAAVSDDTGQRSKRPWWPTALVVVIIVGGIGFLVYSQVQRQINAAVARTESDIRRTHELVLQAAEHRDRDLLNTITSSRDIDWLNEQLQLTEEGLLYNPKPFGVVAQRKTAPEYGFEISADLSEAEVVITRSFTVQSPTGISETVALKQYALYRRGQDRWFFSPPKDVDAFWEREATVEGQYLTITYPMRDADEVEHLHDYLEAKLAEMCTGLPDFSCPDDLHISLELSTDPTSLIEMQDVDLLFDNSPNLTLPTFTLVGIPADETARDAIHRAYAAQTLGKAMVNALDWDCCLRGLFFRALIDYQLAELGIRAYPLHPAEYERLFAQFEGIDQLNSYWRLRQIELVDAQTWQWPYAVVEFALSTPLSDATAGAMQTSLMASSPYLDWLNDLFSTNVLDVTVQQAWLNFIYGSSLSGRVAAGTYAPQQDILLICDTISSPRTRLYRYDWQAEEWLEAGQFEESVFYMASMPDDSAVIFQVRDFEGQGATFLWENGRKTVLLDGTKPEQAGYFFVGVIAPDGRKLLLGKEPQAEVALALLDIDSCIGEGCQLLALPGIPNWSPDGSQYTLDLFPVEYVGYFQSTVGIGRVDESGNIIRITDNGFSSFWLNEETYGFITFGEKGAVYAAMTADDEPYLLLSADDLMPFIPEEQQSELLAIQSVVPNPANRNIIAITAVVINRDQYSYYLFYWNRQLEEIKLISTIDWVNIGEPEWLPGGEWLVVPTYTAQQTAVGEFSPWSYYLFDVAGGGQPIHLARDGNLSHPAYDRSMDGGWLVIAHPSYLEVVGLKHPIAGDQPYRRLLPHDFNNCRDALFIW